MTKGRLEAFSDGVLAIIITIMVLELKVPIGVSFKDLTPLIPKFLSYLLSFIYVGIYWNNHHHLFQAVHKISGKVLWANHGLLFSLSIIPFTTAWMGEHHFASHTVILYGINLLLCAIAFTVLAHYVIQAEGKDSVLAKAVGNHLKEYFSVSLYVMGITTAFFQPQIGAICYAISTIIWLIPDRRIEKNL